MKTLKMDWVMFPIRMVLGIIFFVHGLKKVKFMEDTIQHFYVDYGLSVWITYVVTCIELLGGALLIIGFFTRIVSFGIAIIMLGAIFTVTWEKGFLNGYEFNLALLAMAVSLIYRRTD